MGRKQVGGALAYTSGVGQEFPPLCGVKLLPQSREWNSMYALGLSVNTLPKLENNHPATTLKEMLLVYRPEPSFHFRNFVLP